MGISGFPFVFMNTDLYKILPYSTSMMLAVWSRLVLRRWARGREVREVTAAEWGVVVMRGVSGGRELEEGLKNQVRSDMIILHEAYPKERMKGAVAMYDEPNLGIKSIL